MTTTNKILGAVRMSNYYRDFGLEDLAREWWDYALSLFGDHFSSVPGSEKK